MEGVKDETKEGIKFKNMGKHERQSIKGAEKTIVKILGSKNLNSSDTKNRWFKHAFFIAKKIGKDFTKITFARHLGNRYDNTGDILTISNGKEILIEVKMSDTKLGVGTKANISQNALTENYLFSGNIKSWSKFREEKQHDKWVNDYLGRYTKYPLKIYKITNLILQKEAKARHLRDLKKKRNKIATDILGLIREKDRREKIEYLAYLDVQKQRKDMIKRFLILIILGIHKKEVIQKLIQKDNFFQEVKDLIVYYGNLDKGKIIVRKEDVGEKIKKILKEYSEFEIIFPKELTHCKLVGVRGGKTKSLLQIVLHWKNIAQGIKTPCLNIFDLTV